MISLESLRGYFRRRDKSFLQMRGDAVFGASLHDTMPTAADYPYGVAANTTNGVQLSQPDGLGGFTWITPGTGSGNVTGQAVSVDSEIALFSGTGGKTIKRANGTGIVVTTSGVYATLASTGSGLAVRDTSPTIVTPTIASFTNATHNHTNAAGGGVLGPAAIGVIGIYQDSDYTGSNVNTAQKIFDESTNGAATVASSTAYEIKGVYHVHSTGTTSATLSILFGGTATLTSIGYMYNYNFATTETFGAMTGGWSSVATATVLGGAVASARHYTVYVDGIVRVNAGGTFIPQMQFSAAPGVAPVTLANSRFTLRLIGANTVTTIGTWT